MSRKSRTLAPVGIGTDYTRSIREMEANIEDGLQRIEEEEIDALGDIDPDEEQDFLGQSAAEANGEDDEVRDLVRQTLNHMLGYDE